MLNVIPYSHINTLYSGLHQKDRGDYKHPWFFFAANRRNLTYENVR